MTRRNRGILACQLFLKELSATAGDPMNTSSAPSMLSKGSQVISTSISTWTVFYPLPCERRSAARSAREGRLTSHMTRLTFGFNGQLALSKHSLTAYKLDRWFRSYPSSPIYHCSLNNTLDDDGRLRTVPSPGTRCEGAICTPRRCR